MFDRTASLVSNQIINYRCDVAEKWLVLIGIAPGAQEVTLQRVPWDQFMSTFNLFIRTTWGLNFDDCVTVSDASGQSAG